MKKDTARVLFIKQVYQPKENQSRRGDSRIARRTITKFMGDS
jgi:hypothetical protein